MNMLEEKIIKELRKNILEKGEYPNVGREAVKCKDCSFYMVACFPKFSTVGCFSGWNLGKD